MALVTFQNISKEYGAAAVLRGVSFQISPGQKLGLIGPNGSGKTTILRILLGQESPSDGSVAVSLGARVGYVPQYVEYRDDETVLDCVLGEHRRLSVVLQQKEHELAQADPAAVTRALRGYQRARDDYDRMQGDHFPQRAREMLDALGLAGREHQKVAQLSGGEKNVLSLTQALLAEPNLLLLDEPGNHLDYMGIAWLEQFLSRFKGVVLIVSHNRYLLDRVVDGILDLNAGRVKYYGGNYSTYQQTRLRDLLAQQANYIANQKRLARLEALVRKFADIAQGHASDSSWGKRLRSRRSQLEREKAQAVAKPVLEQHAVRPQFQTDPTRANVALQVRSYRKAFGDLTLFEDADLEIAGGQRWALVGPNGSGKTTLLRDIIQLGDWNHPVIRIGPSLTVGYCSQEQELLTGNSTILDEIMAINNMNQQGALDLLARFLFRADETWKRVSELSGGERNRLQLARLMILKPNFLILDEPTNHLDIPTCEAVEEALADFEGTLLVVSHDRYFLDKIVDHVAEVRDRKLYPYEGNFTSFWFTRRAAEPEVTGRIAQRRKVRAAAPAADKPRAKTVPDSSPPKPKRPSRAVLELEQRIADAEKLKTELEQSVADAFTRGDHRQGSVLARQLEQLTADLESLYAQWLDHSA